MVDSREPPAVCSVVGGAGVLARPARSTEPAELRIPGWVAAPRGYREIAQKNRLRKRT
jgi:hypothetical protein